LCWTWAPSNRALERDGTSDGRMDRAAVPTCVTGETPYRFLIRDRDGIYSQAVDRALTAMGLRVLKTPPLREASFAFTPRPAQTGARGVARRELDSPGHNDLDQASGHVVVPRR
jgi:hypothetical protein